MVVALAQRYADAGPPLGYLLRAGSRGLEGALKRAGKAPVDPELLARAILVEIRACVRAWLAPAKTRAHETEATVTAALATLAARGVPSPTVREIAHVSGLSEERVIEALVAHADRLAIIRGHDPAGQAASLPADANPRGQRHPSGPGEG